MTEQTTVSNSRVWHEVCERLGYEELGLAGTDLAAVIAMLLLRIERLEEQKDN